MDLSLERTGFERLHNDVYRAPKWYVDTKRARYIMNYEKFRFLLPDERIAAYQEEIEQIKDTLSLFGLSLDSSCAICDYVLSLPAQEYPAQDKKRYKGVYKRPNGTYYSKITKSNQYTFIGNFDTTKEAALSYDIVCWKLYKNIDKLNFPELIERDKNAE